MLFQQDSATPHTLNENTDLLKEEFNETLISLVASDPKRIGELLPYAWSPGRCDLTPLDYFLLG